MDRAYRDGRLVMDSKQDLVDEIDRLRAALEFYADPKNWWNENAGDRMNYHNADLDGSIERMNARVGVIEPAGTRFVHAQFFNDCGSRARAALGVLR